MKAKKTKQHKYKAIGWVNEYWGNSYGKLWALRSSAKIASIQEPRDYLRTVRVYVKQSS